MFTCVTVLSSFITMCVFFFSTVLSGQMFWNGAWCIGFSVTQQVHQSRSTLGFGFLLQLWASFLFKLSAEQSWPASWPTVSLHLKQREKKNYIITRQHCRCFSNDPSLNILINFCHNRMFVSFTKIHSRKSAFKI